MWTALNQLMQRLSSQSTDSSGWLSAGWVTDDDQRRVGCREGGWAGGWWWLKHREEKLGGVTMLGDASAATTASMITILIPFSHILSKIKYLT